MAPKLHKLQKYAVEVTKNISSSRRKQLSKLFKNSNYFNPHP